MPKGTKNSVLFDDDFGAVSDLLRIAVLTSRDFEHVIDACADGDLLLVDPPYTFKHNSNGFLRYNEKIFSWADQVRLRNAAVRAKGRGAEVLICNADHGSIHDLYAGSRRINVLERQSVMAADKSKRRGTTELLVRL